MIIIVLILMVVSTLFVLVTMQYFRTMMSTFESVYTYYKSYYLARGSMDLLLTQVAYRGRGYETDFLDEGNSILCAGTCRIEGSVRSRSSLISAGLQQNNTTCTKDAAIRIAPGQTHMYPLFFDSLTALNLQPIQQLRDYLAFQSNRKVDMYVYDSPQAGDLFWYNTREGDFGKAVKFDSVSTFPLIGGVNSAKSRQDLLSIVPNQPGIFLLINNPSRRDNPLASEFTYCIEALHKNIIGPRTVIRTQAEYNGMQVALESITTNRFPSILIQ